MNENQLTIKEAFERYKKIIIGFLYETEKMLPIGNKTLTLDEETTFSGTKEDFEEWAKEHSTPFEDFSSDTIIEELSPGYYYRIIEIA